MRRITSLFICVVLSTLCLPAFANCKGGKTCKTIPQAVSTPSFDLLKSLSGTWSGTWNEGGKKMPMQVKYRVTSGGSAVEETIFSGTPMEMVSMYTVYKGKVQMTHYCLMGNQPRMREVKAGPKQIALKFVHTPGINPAKDSYMGGITLTLKDTHHLGYNGNGFKDGKPKSCGGENILVRK